MAFVGIRFSEKLGQLLTHWLLGKNNQVPVEAQIPTASTDHGETLAHTVFAIYLGEVCLSSTPPSPPPPLPEISAPQSSLATSPSNSKRFAFRFRCVVFSC